MTKKVTILALALFFLSTLFQYTNVKAGTSGAIKNSPAQNGQVISKRLDRQAQILQAYLAKFDSPMQYHAQDFIDAAKVYNLPWNMLPAIAGVESSFGKQIPGGYNAYGWGAYDAYHAVYFDSWPDGIYTVAKGLRENYLNKGLNDPFSINKIYAASHFWGNHVSYFMNDLEKFASNYQEENEAQIGISPNIAAISGQIASN